MNICLASTSSYRSALLKKLHIPFITAQPNIDETPFKDETAAELVLRLARQKAEKVATKLSGDYLIIGSDQVACLDDKTLGKPGNFDNALSQLTQCQGKKIQFLTGLTVFNSQTKQHKSLVEPFNVHFRQLDKQALSTYLQIEQPYDCAGSFKSEGLGICLFSELQGRDPNSLVGLPLIGLQELLQQQGYDIFQHMLD